MEDIDQGGQPAEIPADQAPPAQPAPEAPKPETPAPSPSLAAAIRQAREEREARSRERVQTHELQSKLARLEEELKAARDADNLDDAVAWARAKNLSKDRQAEFAQSLLYDLVPDKAPADFRVKLLESKMRRERAEAEAEKAKQAEEARKSWERQQLNDYASAVQTAARSFAAGSHPESEAWFGDDRDAHARSLLATAENLARRARETGQQANLDPAHVAGVLEAEIAERMKRRDSRRQPGASTRGQEGAAKIAPEGAPQSAGKPTSTKGLSTGGPRGPALTEKERLARAIAAGFPTK